MIRRYPDGSIVFHALVRYTPGETLTLDRRLDGEPVTGQGWMKAVSVALDNDHAQYLDLLLQSWMLDEPRADPRPAPACICKPYKDVTGNDLEIGCPAETHDLGSFAQYAPRADPRPAPRCTCDCACDECGGHAPTCPAAAAGRGGGA